MTTKIDILEMRERARQELIALFGVKPSEITEEKIMYMVGLYQSEVDTTALAISMMDQDWAAQYPSTPNEDLEDSEEERAKLKWERCRVR